MNVDFLVSFGSDGDGGLGDYIFALNPYKAVPVRKGVFNVPYPKALYRQEEKDKPDPDSEDAQDHPVVFFLDTTGIEHNEQPGTWIFKSTDHFVDRGLRIPYMYYKDVRSAQQEYDAVAPVPPAKVKYRQLALVRDYFLIGFEGGVAYGKR